MPRVRLRVTGAAGAARAIQRMGRESRDNMKRVIRDISERIRSEAATAAPRLSGGLKRSMRVHISRQGLSSEIGSDLFYSPFVELGTKRSKRQQFLRPAFEAGKRLVRPAVQREIERAARAAKQVVPGSD